jgi:peptidyl-dipeptidase A
VAKFDKEVKKSVVVSFPVETVTDEKLKRLHGTITKLGDSALDSVKFTELQKLGAKMSNIYSTAKICRNPLISADRIADCPEKEKLDLEPGITQLMAKSRDPKLLLHAWKSWRDASGKHMRKDYERYVTLKNEAAVADGDSSNHFV